MPAKKLSAAFITLALFGCSSHTPSAAATGVSASNSSSSDSGSAPSSNVDLTRSFQDKAIVDPALKMTAFDVEDPGRLSVSGNVCAGIFV